MLITIIFIINMFVSSNGIANVKFLPLSNDIVQIYQMLPNLEVLALNNKLGLNGDIYELLKSPPQHVSNFLQSRLKCILLQELYCNFLSDSVEYLLQDVNVLKKLTIIRQCSFMLGNPIPHSFES